MQFYAVVVSISIFYLINAPAYETQTHSRFTTAAVEISILDKDLNLLADLGLDITTSVAFFPSLVPSDTNGSDPNHIIFLKNASINRIISGGAVLEDAGSRSKHHFYDPQNGGLGGSTGHRSPDWILENVIPPQTGDSLDVTLPGQEFSYKDARRYFYNALTSPGEETRRTNYGLMFRSLGHVIHHIQDMAQPQHVRNDAHCDATNGFPGIALLCLLTWQHNPSYFERYTNDRIIFLTISNLELSPPNFKFVRNFWANVNGTGIAQFTSLNFVSDGTNYQGDINGSLTHHPSFPAPVPLQTVVPVTLSSLLDEDVSMPEDLKQSTLQRLNCNADPENECIVDFIQNQILGDEFGYQSVINTRSSAISIFDEEIRSRNLEITNRFLPTYRTKRLVSLNRFNFETVYPYLLPLAVTYSAGLINHFFRGRLDVEEIRMDDYGNALVTVRNSSTSGNILKRGDFELFYESIDEGRKPVNQVSVATGTLPLAVGDTMQLSVVPPDDVSIDDKAPYFLVFNAMDGVIGEEPGIAAINFEMEFPGKVDRLFSGVGNCPARVYAVWIHFEQQPANNGQVVLQGAGSLSVFNFQTIPANVPVIRNDAQWLHTINEISGKYLYSVSYRYGGSSVDPCSAGSLGAWLQGEEVLPLNTVLE